MTYKPEDIKPKQDKPTQTGEYWCYSRTPYGSIGFYRDRWNGTSWILNPDLAGYIPVVGAPPELKPLAYPENKPDEIGLYMAHWKIDDVWQPLFWMGNKWECDDEWGTPRLDYFIPVRLDRKDDEMEDRFVDFTDEELLLELINRNVMGEAPKKTKYITPHREVLIAIGNNETAHIRFPMEAFSELCDIVYDRKDDEMDVIWETDGVFVKAISDEAVTEFCKDWLDLQGYDDTKCKPEIKAVDTIKGKRLWNDVHIEICDMDGFDNTFIIASTTNTDRYVFVTGKQLAECDKAVKERKPEIKACPNPEC